MAALSFESCSHLLLPESPYPMATLRSPGPLSLTATIGWSETHLWLPPIGHLDFPRSRPMAPALRLRNHWTELADTFLAGFFCPQAHAPHNLQATSGFVVRRRRIGLPTCGPVR